MAVTHTLLPLTRFAEILGYSPMLFNQVAVEDLQPAGSCSDPVLEYTWQPAGGGRPGRNEIAQAVQQAEAAVWTHLGFPPTPTWITEDTVPAWKPRWASWMLGAKASNAYIIEGGVEAWSLIDAAAEVVYTDADGDGYAEQATVTATLPAGVDDPNDIAVTYPGDRAREIRPTSVTIGSGTATVVFARHCAVKPNLLERLDATAVDGLDDDSFLATVDVYRHYNDPSVQASVLWQPAICDASGCAVSEQDACIAPSPDGRLPIVTVQAGTYNTESGQWDRTCPRWWAYPQAIRLNYRAGPRDTGTRQLLDAAVTRLALTFMDGPWTCCETMRGRTEYWLDDLAVRNEARSFAVSREMLDNPFGTTRAAQFAWRVVRNLQVGQAVLA